MKNWRGETYFCRYFVNSWITRNVSSGVQAEYYKHVMDCYVDSFYMFRYYQYMFRYCITGAFENGEDVSFGATTVSGWADTSSSVEVTSDGTLIFSWDTNQIPTSSTFGEAKGTYAVQVLYWANGQKIISPRFYVSVN